MSSSLRPHGLQHARLPCPSLSPGVCSNSCPLSRWCHPTISSSVIPFFSCPQSFPASESFWMSQLLASGGQSIEASPSVLPVNIQGWLLQDWLKVNWLWLVWSPCSQTTLKSPLIPHHSSKASVLWCSAFFMVQLSHLYMTTRKTLALMIWTFVGKSDVSAF